MHHSKTKMPNLSVEHALEGKSVEIYAIVLDDNITMQLHKS